MENDRATEDELIVSVVGPDVLRLGVEALLAAQPGIRVAADEAALVTLVLGNIGLRMIPAFEGGGPKRAKRLAFLTDGDGIDFAVLDRLGVSVLISSDESLGYVTEGLYEAARGVGYCSPRLVPILPSAANSETTGAVSPISKTRRRGRSLRTRPSPDPVQFGPRLTLDAGAKTEAENDVEMRTLQFGMSLGLTEKQSLIAVQAAIGLTNREISEQLHLSLATVKFHLSCAYHKLGIHRRAQLETTLVNPIHGSRQAA